MDQTKRITLKSSDDLGPLLARVKDEEWISLNLSANSIGNEVANAFTASLPNLTSLNLSVNSIGDEATRTIATFVPNLTALDLGHNNIGDEGVKALAELLSNLASLNLYNNRIGDEGARAIAASLPNLTSLVLSHNSIGGEGAKALAASLPNLTMLGLAGNRIGNNAAKAIAASLPNLTSLKLDNNSIGDEGAKAIAASLPNLTSLDLDNNSIGDEGAKAIAASLPNLTSLELGYNSIGDEGAKAILDSWSKRFGVNRPRSLNLQNNRDLSALLPKEILANASDPGTILAAYRRLAEGDKKALNEAKLLVVGNEAVGKTSLLRYLINGKPRDPAEQKTPGIVQEKIEIERWSLEASSVCLNVWDFGGQEMMRGTHRFFLTARSLYLLVLEDRREDDRSIHDWLKTIRNRGADSPILVVINKSDEGKQALRLDEAGLRKDYPEIVGFLRTSCNDDDYSRGSIQALREKIVDTVAHDDGLKHVRDPFPASWLRIKDAVTDLAGEKSVLPLSEFQRLCEQSDAPAERVTDEDERRSLLRLLNDLGTIVAHGLDRETPRVTQDITLLDPNWLTGAVYQILNHPTVRDQQGEFTRAQWADWLDPVTYPEKHHNFILDMMQDEEVGLCFRLPTAASDERYLIPEALPASKPDYQDIWPEDTLRFRYHYGYLPPGLVPRFIVQAHRNLTKQKTRWRQGALFAAEGCKILVEANIAASPKRIDIQVCGPNERRRAALAVILNELNHVHALNPECGAKPRVPLPDQPERDVSYDHLLTREAQHGPTYIIDPEGAERTYTVAELLDGVRHEQRLERYPKDAERRYNVQAKNVTFVDGSLDTNGGNLQIGTGSTAEQSGTKGADTPAIQRWVPLICAGAAALLMALVLYQFDGLNPAFIMTGSAIAFAAVYALYVLFNPDYIYRRLIAFVTGVLAVGNFGGPILDASFVSKALSASIQWDGTAPQSFNIVGLLILVLLAALEWQRMQQAGKMSPV